MLLECFELLTHIEVIQYHKRLVCQLGYIQKVCLKLILKA